MPFEDEKLPMGSHRYPKAWLEDRYRWVDDNGVPLEANWDEKCGGGVESIEDMADATQHGDHNCKVKLACQPEAPVEEVHFELDGDVDMSSELPEQVPPSIELAEATKNRRKRSFDEHLSDQTSKVNPEKAIARQKIKQAYKILLPKWREEQRAMGLSRKQLLSVLVPEAGVKNKNKKIIESSKKAFMECKNGIEVKQQGNV